MLRLLLASFLTLLFSACAGRSVCPSDTTTHTVRPARPGPGAFDFPTDAPLAGRSAFRLLSEPADAYAARLYLVDHARKTLDVQYYIFKDDRIGNDFLYHLYLAAERGVKVRILLDDLTTTGEDTDWAMAACHPNIELKIFNPNPWRRFFRNVALVLGIETLGKRMHNKALVADGQAAIVGGRNIGDEYFLRGSPVMFIDADVVAVGAVVPKIAEAFEIYWRSEQAVAADEVLEGAFDAKTLRDALKSFLAENEAFENSDAFAPVRMAPFLRPDARTALPFTVARDAWFYYDLPEKVSGAEASFLSRRLRRDIEGAKERLVLVSPYFIPTGRMLERLEAARRRGVEVTVVTNSLASTDVAVVYSGYRKYIEPLLKMGVRLYEVKPVPLPEAKISREERRQRRMSLHTKMVVIDKERLVVGSANVDPRSAKLNTEYLLEIDAPPLVAQVDAQLASVIDETRLYRLAWEHYPAWAANGDEGYEGPVWITKERDEEVRYYRPPGVGFFKRLGIGLFGLLPVEGQL